VIGVYDKSHTRLFAPSLMFYKISMPSLYAIRPDGRLWVSI